MKRIAVTIRGVDYPTLRAAALAIGVSDRTVARAYNAGTLDNCGMGVRGPKPMPVRVNGVVYPTAAIAAQKVGCGLSTIYGAISQGRENDVGTAKAKWRCGRARAVVLGGISFPSGAAASRALGFGPNYVWRALNRNCAASRERVMAAAMAYSARQSVAAGRRAHG